MTISMDVDWTTALGDLERILACFPPGLENEASDINISYGGVSVRRAGRSEAVDVEVPPILIPSLASSMASAFDLEINRRTPILEKRLPPRYRISLSHPAVTQDGRWNLSIRFLPVTTYPLADYVERGYVELETAKRLLELARSRNTILIAGATGSGKTTLLRTLIGEVPVSDRLVVIEQGAELNVARPNMAALEDSEGANFEDLIAHTLRLDPDLIVVGEVRGREASRFITIAAAGHPCATTIHAESGAKALIRLHRMIRLSEPHFEREELEGAIDAVIHVALDPMTGGRRVTLWEPQQGDQR